MLRASAKPSRGHWNWLWRSRSNNRLFDWNTRRPSSRCGYATVLNSEDGPKAGDTIHGFTLKRTKHVPELELTAFHLEHDTTGAEYLHVARDDKNNVFSIGFKTNPPDDTGVPHILEHTTLCGSHRLVCTSTL